MESAQNRWNNHYLKGEFQGIPPTGKKIEYGTLQLWIIKEGKIAVLWLQGDILMMMNQLGMELKPKQEE
jgi:predicted ester cyclase